MSELTVLQGGLIKTIPFEGPTPLAAVLAAGGAALPHPCGGRGVCGKCAAVLEGMVSEPNEAERRAGTRLTCQAVLLGDARVILPDPARGMEIELSGGGFAAPVRAMPGRFGAAVDIGTTTIALKLFDLTSGKCLGEAGMLNPQTSVAADVIGRIGYALEHGPDRLQAQVCEAVSALLADVCRNARIDEKDAQSLVVTGNTTMLYLLTGRNPLALSHAPFEADHLFGETVRILGRNACLPPCMNAFVGADITCACLASGQCETGDVSLLCDVGTNGEIALWKDGTLYVSSTAAGPAFEGAGISCGCGSVAGAIDRVWIEDGRLCYHTVGEANPIGVCGSGLLDAVAAFLKLGLIDETGAAQEERLMIGGGIALLPRDVRAVQLAKAAIAAGIRTILHDAHVRSQEIRTLYIAGGFGSHLCVENAAAIGLIPGELTSRVRVIGNAALTGAARLLLNEGEQETARAIAVRSRHVNLSGNPVFNGYYMDEMFFPEQPDAL